MRVQGKKIYERSRFLFWSPPRRREFVLRLTNLAIAEFWLIFPVGPTTARERALRLLKEATKCTGQLWTIDAGVTRKYHHQAITVLGLTLWHLAKALCRDREKVKSSRVSFCFLRISLLKSLLQTKDQFTFPSISADVLFYFSFFEGTVCFCFLETLENWYDFLSPRFQIMITKKILIANFRYGQIQ